MSIKSTQGIAKLRAAISAATLQLASGASRLASAVVSQKLVSSITASTLSAATSASTLAAQYVKGIFFKFKEFTDSASTTDTTSFDIDKTIADTQAVTDLTALNVTRPVTDTASMTDSNTLAVTKGPQDTATVTDGDPIFDVTKGPRDIAIASELFTVDLSKVLSDSVNATDDVNGAAAGDESKLRVFKVVTDNGSVAESHVLSPTKGLSDSASTSESGLVFAQDYVDNPQYFASDYVGQSQSF
jgi:hypothetical protein